MILWLLCLNPHRFFIFIRSSIKYLLIFLYSYTLFDLKIAPLFTFFCWFIINEVTIYIGNLVGTIIFYFKQNTVSLLCLYLFFLWLLLIKLRAECQIFTFLKLCHTFAHVCYLTFWDCSQLWVMSYLNDERAFKVYPVINDWPLFWLLSISMKSCVSKAKKAKFLFWT